MTKVDVNCDLGESFGHYQLGMDADVIPLITSANVACGFHASDPVEMEKTVLLAHENGVAVGAHPGFPDLVGFGRRNMNLSAKEVRAIMLYQMGALSAFCKECGIPMQHVKPHGALYNMAAKDETLAEAICEAIAEFDDRLILLALSGSCMLDAARRKGIRSASEVFADRAYEEDGTLVSRSKPGAMIEDEETAVRRAVRMVKDGQVESITGRTIAIRADSVCVHGDNEKALAFVKKIRAALAAEGIAAAPLHEIV